MYTGMIASCCTRNRSGSLSIRPGYYSLYRNYAALVSNESKQRLCKLGQSSLTGLVTTSLVDQAIQEVVGSYIQQQELRQVSEPNPTIGEQLMNAVVEDNIRGLALMFQYDPISATATLRREYKTSYQLRLRHMADEIKSEARGRRLYISFTMEELETAVGLALKQHFESGTRQFRFH